MDEPIEPPECTPRDAFDVLLTAGHQGITCSYRVFGSQLGLDTAELNTIQHNLAGNYQQQLFKMLDRCSQKFGLSWARLVEVLRRPALQENAVAKEIEDKYVLVRRDSSISLDSAMSLSLSASMSSSGPFSPISPSPMEFDMAEVECSIPNVVNEIVRRGVQDWQSLGVFQDLSSVDMTFPSECGLIECLQRLVEAWFRTDPNPSWDKLRSAITDHEASTRRESYDSLSSIPSTPTSPIDVESELMDFERRFGRLEAEARRELERKTRAIDLIEDHLYTLPRRIMREHSKYITSVSKRVKRFPNLTLFFQHLHLHCWNFFEYKVLEALIRNNCSTELQQKMRRYVKGIESFKQRTTISEFIKCDITEDIVKRASVPQTFRKLTAEYDIDPDKYTLSKLDEFRSGLIRSKRDRDVCLSRTLSECAMQFYVIKHGSIIVEWIFLEEFTEALVELFSSDEGREILDANMIVKVWIDDKTLPTMYLLVALKKEDLNEMQSILEDAWDADIDVNATYEENEQTVLLYMSKCGNTEIVNLLVLKWNADVNKSDMIHRTALMFSSHEGHKQIVQFLLENGALPNLQADGGWTALMLASYRGHVETVEILLDPKYHTDVNATTEHGLTALQRVCLFSKARYPEAKYDTSKNRGKVAKLLLDHGTDIWILDDEGRTPLIAASDSGFADIVKLLIDKISEFPDEERQKYLDHKKHFSWTALMSASEKGHHEVVQLLIEAGATRNLTKEKDGVSALHIAVQNRHTEVVEVLTHKMEKDDLNARDDYGMTPLMLATKNRSEQLINVLIHAGVDVDAKSSDKEQMTALMFAVKVGSFDVVKMLVENNADIFAIDAKSQTVLEMAKHSSKEIHDYLSQKCKEAEEKRAKASD